MVKELAELKRNDDGELLEESVLWFANRYGCLDQVGGYHNSLSSWDRFSRIFQQVLGALEVEDMKTAMDIYNNFPEPPEVSIGIVGNDFHGQHHRSIRIQPKTLISAMWLMVTDMFTNGVHLQSCENPGCQRWIVERSNKNTCSDACRQALYRKRKQGA
ncbi:MAG: hypothetical protein CMH27_05435 [Micavibrio sp.]|nr:hypothetical protein [Micavibrio sp.]|tara:strand:+ start:52 stop:528 length:477 start_codon:yes stop_codon:yes gene_type:complete